MLLRAETVVIGDAGDFSYHARFALEGSGPHTMSLSWRNTADSTLYAVIAEVPAGSDDPLFPSRCRYTAGSVRGDSITIDADGIFTATIGKKPAFTMVLRRTAGGTAVSFGSDRPEASVEVPFDADTIRTEARQGTSLLRHSLIVRYRRTSEKSQFDTEEKISAHLASSADPMEAEWTYLDRDLSASKARLGGRYRLATISNGEGYDISTSPAQRPAGTPATSKGASPQRLFRTTTISNGSRPSAATPTPRRAPTSSPTA